MLCCQAAIPRPVVASQHVACAVEWLWWTGLVYFSVAHRLEAVFVQDMWCGVRTPVRAPEFASTIHDVSATHALR